MQGDPDVAVIGSGPNGLVAACTLARRGFRVLVLEANPSRPGGALGSAELTRPGFVHDVGAAFFPMKDSPAFRELNLESTGLRFEHALFASCHPALDGSYAAISPDPDVTAQHFGSAEDGATWRKLAAFHAQIAERLERLLLGPFPSWGALVRFRPLELLTLLRTFATSSAGLSRRKFDSEAARRVIPALGMHVDVGPSDPWGAALGYMLALGAGSAGYPVPRGGAQAFTNALVTILERHGGELRLGARVNGIVLDKGRVRGIRLERGRELNVRRGVLADTALRPLLLDLVGPEHLPRRVLRALDRFVQGPGTVKVDWALSAPVPWTCAIARQSAVVHTGEDIDDLDSCTRQVRAGHLPARPYLVVGQQSLCDPSRAPHHHHTLYCYTRVPAQPKDGNWDSLAQPFADTIEARIEELAPGFRKAILARRVSTPGDLARANENLVDGDIGGGDNSVRNQLLFRPFFPHFRYAMPVRGLYLCSSYTHPGAGVHGMCGYNAALRAARELG